MRLTDMWTNILMHAAGNTDVLDLVITQLSKVFVGDIRFEC